VLKKAKIDGGIPPIGSKNSKMEDFTLIKRKTSAYFHEKALDFTINRKTSAYLTFAGYSLKEKTS
jgi:hypothetical protein